MDYITINKRLKTPIYKQIANSIRSAIQEDLLKHNDHLPTEEEICATYNISNIVVKQAYQSLVDEGLVYRIRGKGTYVSNLEALKIHFNQFDDFESLWLQKGMSKKTLLWDHLVLPYKLQSLLKHKDKQPWFELKLVGKIRNNSLFIQDLYLHPDLEHYIDFEKLNQIHLQSELKELTVEHEFSVGILSFDQARLLQQDHFAPVHVVRSVYKDKNKIVAILIHTILNEALHFEFVLGDPS